jgi:hypothetical protein
MPHLKKSTKFWVKTHNGRAHNRSLGVDVTILKERVREEDDSAYSFDSIKMVSENCKQANEQSGYIYI